MREKSLASDPELQLSIPLVFDRTATNYADRVAVEDRDSVVTYQQVNSRANRLARAIIALNAELAQPVIILISQSVACIIAILAALKAGKAYVPLDPADPLPELLKVFKQFSAPLILCSSDSREVAKQLWNSQSELINEEEISDQFQSSNIQLDISPDQLASIYFTSGTTGDPKGVMDTHQNIIHNAKRYASSLNICPADRHSLVQSPIFSGTASTIFSCLLNGASVFPVDLRKNGIPQTVSWLDSKRITVWHSVPLILQRAIDAGFNGKTLRLIRLEGDQLNGHHVAQFRKHFLPDTVLVNGLGTTETGLVRQFFINGGDPIGDGRVPLGHAVPDVEVSVLRQDGSKVAKEQEGEILVRSRYLAKGYWGRPDLTATKFYDDPSEPGMRLYRTGDFGILRDDGCLEYLGRRETQAKVRGRTVDLASIEVELCRQPGVKRALVILDGELTASQQLVAYITADGKKTRMDALRRHLSKHLADWQIPAHFVFLEELPCDRHGKVKRSGLPPRSRSRPHLDVSFRTPQSSLEKLVARCFEEVLAVEGIGLDDDFFDLGGDSLLAVNLSALLEERLERHFFPDFVFDHPTIASQVAGLTNPSVSSTVYALRIAESGTPLFCINPVPDMPSGFLKLAQLLESQTVYVLRARRATIYLPDMARELTEALRDVQPRGPYKICGNCFGGTVAFEMAQQLREVGETVSLLGLIDTAFPPRQPNLAARVRVYRRVWRNLITVEKVKARLARAAIRLRVTRSETGLNTRQALRIAELGYKPRPYAGSTFLFIAGKLSNQKGWQNVVMNGLEIVQIADLDWDNEDDRPHLTSEPLVHLLARELQTVLAR